jgi:hypothetical protein
MLFSLALASEYARNRRATYLYSRHKIVGGILVQAGSIEKAGRLRDLLRFLRLRSQVLLSGNTRDLPANEATPGQITSVPLSRALPDALKDTDYSRIASFDLLNGFHGRADDSFLTQQLGLSSRTERLCRGTPMGLLVSRLMRHNEALPSAEHQLFSRTLVLAFGANATAAGKPAQPPPIGI